MRTVREYLGASEVTGPLQPASNTVRYTRVFTRSDNVKLALLGTAHVVAALAFITYLAWPSHLPLMDHSIPYDALAAVGSVLIIALPTIQMFQTLFAVHYASRAVDPVPMVPKPGLRVAMLTTICPGKEPWDVAEKTLLKFKEQIHDGTVDAWILDEGDDPIIKARCAQLGINHFSRKGVPEWNTVEPPRKRKWLLWQSRAAVMPHRAKTKHGNHNSWRAMHEHKYDVVTQMDPDHCPLDSDDFLLRVLGYFNDPDVAFVVAPQVYGNQEQSFVAQGAAELTYVFHGVIQRGCNGLGAPVLIGTNHAYRPQAWKQIGGYQDCIIEDHLTAMVIPSQTNPVTGNRWKGVYTPDILTAGEGPTTFTDFFSQQRRWAYGIFEIATKHSPNILPKVTWHQRISFASLQFFYPSVGATWLLGNVLSAIYLLFGVTSSRLHPLWWAVLFTLNIIPGLGITMWFRKFNLVEHERKSLNIVGMALNLATCPVYLAAGFSQLFGRGLAYKVTAKGALASGDTWETFRLHIRWALFALGCITVGLVMHHAYAALYVWMSLTLLYALYPIAIWLHFKRKAEAAPRHALRRVPVQWDPAPNRIIDLRDRTIDLREPVMKGAYATIED